MPSEIFDAEILDAEPEIEGLILVMPIQRPKQPSLAVRLLDAADNSRLLCHPIIRGLTFMADQLIAMFFIFLTVQARLQNQKNLVRQINLESTHLRRMFEKNRGYVEGS